jgi:hypothetical protein
VRSRLLRASDWRLIAEMPSPNGPTVIAASPTFRLKLEGARYGLIRSRGSLPPIAGELAAALETLARQLARDGWQEDTQARRYSAWHLRAFRREQAD